MFTTLNQRFLQVFDFANVTHYGKNKTTLIFKLSFPKNDISRIKFTIFELHLSPNFILNKQL